MNEKTKKVSNKLVLLVGIQIAIISTSFLILELFESQKVFAGNSVNIAGKNRFLTEMVLNEVKDYYIKGKLIGDPISALAIYEKNLHLLKTGGIQNNINLSPLSEKFQGEWENINDLYLDYKTKIQIFVEPDSTNRETKLVEISDLADKLVAQNDVLTVQLALEVQNLTTMLIWLQAFLIIINIGAHLFMVKMIYSILKKKTEQLVKMEKEIAADKYRSFYEGMPDLCRTINEEGIILDCNMVYTRSLGYTKEEVIGKSIFEHTSEKNLDAMNESFEQWKKTGKVSNKDIWFKRKDGTIFPVLLNATTLTDDKGKLIGSNTVIRDITDIYEARKKLEDSERQIKEQLTNLQKLNSLKDDFLAMITHELKTPLVPIKGYIDILISEKIGPINEEQKKKLEIVSSSTRSLLRLISDLLDAQKIELGQLKLNKDVHDLAEIVTNTVNKMKPDADRYGITMTTDLGNPIALLCDNARIEQVLSNLIFNSLDFCPKPNGKINIKLFSENKHAGIIVKDNGIGISKESLNKIFVKFYQVDTSTTREHGGTGIGLSVCKGIVEGHGGKIWAESDGKDKGAEIHIMLPGVK